jgi:hypothetical protein
MTAARRFAFRLALALGQPNPDALLSEIPARILSEWQEYASLEPFGEERGDWRAAMVASTMANIHARKKGKPAYKIEDFMPKFDKKATTSTIPLIDKVIAANWALGGKVVRIGG